MVIISSVIIAGSTPCICCVYGPLGQPSASYATSALDVAPADVVAATAVVGSVAWAFLAVYFFCGSGSTMVLSHPLEMYALTL